MKCNSSFQPLNGFFLKGRIGHQIQRCAQAREMDMCRFEGRIQIGDAALNGRAEQYMQNHVHNTLYIVYSVEFSQGDRGFLA